MHIHEKTSNEMSGVYIAFESPAMNESPKNFGISHLLEHMICEATDDIDETYDENCVHTNAYTGKEEVVFHMTGLSDRVGQFRDDYIKRILSYEPTEADFKKQVPIVTQEYNDWFTDCFRSTYSNYFSRKYGYIYSVGTREALESITFNDVVEFKNKYFSKPSKLIIADKNDVTVEPIEFAHNIPVKIEPYTYINKDMHINESSVGMVAGSAPVSDNPKNYNLRMIAKMLGYGLKSPLYQRLREQDNLCYWIACFDESLLDKNVIVIATSSDIKNREAMQDGIYEILYHPERYLTKDRYNLMLNNTLANEKVKNQYKHEMNYLNRYFDKDTNSIMKNIDKINYDELFDYYMEHVHPSKRNWDFVDQRELYN